MSLWIPKLLHSAVLPTNPILRAVTVATTAPAPVATVTQAPAASTLQPASSTLSGEN